MSALSFLSGERSPHGAPRLPTSCVFSFPPLPGRSQVKPRWPEGPDWQGGGLGAATYPENLGVREVAAVNHRWGASGGGEWSLGRTFSRTKTWVYFQQF